MGSSGWTGRVGAFATRPLADQNWHSNPQRRCHKGHFYNIFDENILEDLEWAVPAHGGVDQLNPNSVRTLRQIMDNAAAYPRGNEDSMKPMREVFDYVADNIYTGQMPEELVENAGLPGLVAQSAVESINRYNQLCEKKRDDDFGKDSKLLRPLSGRLFLQKSEQRGNLGFMLTTVGGFVTDRTQNVLAHNYEPIPGLYASGNCCGRRFGPMYTTPIAGLSISIALTLGREVGRTMVHL